MPGSWVGRHYPDVGLFEHIARIAERGLFDMIFFGDGSGIPNTWEGGIDAAVRRGVAWPRLDMSPWITAMSRVTSHVSFGLTYASTFMHPFYFARLLNSLDHITNGRIAFNVISSQRRSDYENHGYDELIDHGERYDRMEEFIAVCRALWSSVDPDAFVWDRLNGLVADPAKVRPINHTGRFFKVKGPLSVVPSPQGHPVLIQAGGSKRGIWGRQGLSITCSAPAKVSRSWRSSAAIWMQRCANAAGTRNRSVLSGRPRSSSAKPRTRPKRCASASLLTSRWKQSVSGCRTIRDLTCRRCRPAFRCANSTSASSRQTRRRSALLAC
jgi:alkanesulfonate monooxygenase SsuD/methylene tetrahydromethanopterin reductase-like flavin-dependent oxidoreductase (luciferase family)